VSTHGAIGAVVCEGARHDVVVDVDSSLSPWCCFCVCVCVCRSDLALNDLDGDVPTPASNDTGQLLTKLCVMDTYYVLRSVAVDVVAYRERERVSVCVCCVSVV